jgi:hypothetical protein
MIGFVGVLQPMLLLLALLASQAPQAREVYFEQTTVTMNDGQVKGSGVSSRIWFAGQKMRLEAGAIQPSPALILRLDQGIAYRIDPSEKTALRVSLDDLKMRSQMDLAAAGDLMGGSEAGSARTRELGTRVVSGLSCKGFRIHSASATMDIYVAPSLPVGVDAFADFLEWSGANQSLPGFLSEIRALNGFPMETRSRVSVLGHVQETASTVTKVKVGPLDKSLFEPPPDYRLVTETEPKEETR